MTGYRDTGLAGYAAALETILRALPGKPTVNGRAMSTEAAIADLRVKFDLGPEAVEAIDKAKAYISGDSPWPQP